MKEKVTLVVVDFQYDFCLLGAPLYVPGSDKALWNISHLIENNKVGRVIFTADWHPSNHCSFKKNGGQWNEHCVQFSKGAAIHDLLLYGCIGAGIPYEVITKGTLSLSEEYGIKVALANATAIHRSIALTPTDGLGISNSDLDQIGAKSYNDVDRVLQTLVCPASPENDRVQDALTVEIGPEIIDKIIKRRRNSRFKREKSPIYISRERYE